MANIVPECSHLITYIGAWVPFISVFHIYFSINYFWKELECEYGCTKVLLSQQHLFCVESLLPVSSDVSLGIKQVTDHPLDKKNRSFCQSEPTSLKRMIEMMSEQLETQRGMVLKVNICDWDWQECIVWLNNIHSVPFGKPVLRICLDSVNIKQP